MAGSLGVRVPGTGSVRDQYGNPTDELGHISTPRFGSPSSHRGLGGGGGVKAPTGPTERISPGGGGGGGKGATGPVVNFDPSKFKQDIQPNPYQTKAYAKMEDLYDEVPDYYKQALAEGRRAGTGVLTEIQGMMGGRGFGPGSGMTGHQMLGAGQDINRMILGGQFTAADKTFGAKAGLAGAMGNLGTGIGGLMNQAFGNNIGAYNALANYALGTDSNRIRAYDAESRRMSAEMAPQELMWNVALQAMRYM